MQEGKPASACVLLALKGQLTPKSKTHIFPLTCPVVLFIHVDCSGVSSLPFLKHN